MAANEAPSGAPEPPEAASAAPTYEQHVRKLALGDVWDLDLVSVQLFVEEFDRRRAEVLRERERGDRMARLVSGDTVAEMRQLRAAETENHTLRAEVAELRRAAADDLSRQGQETGLTADEPDRAHWRRAARAVLAVAAGPEDTDLDGDQLCGHDAHEKWDGLPVRMGLIRDEVKGSTWVRCPDPAVPAGMPDEFEPYFRQSMTRSEFRAAYESAVREMLAGRDAPAAVPAPADEAREVLRELVRLDDLPLRDWLPTSGTDEAWNAAIDRARALLGVPATTDTEEEVGGE